MDDLFSFYKNANVLITGHTGFKGSWLTLWLTELGANVIGYALDPPTEPSLFNILNLKDKITNIIGDIRDENSLKRVFKTYKPEFVFHMAAQSLVRRSYIEPRYTYETNIMGTINLLEAVKEIKSVRVVVIITSDKCYENKEWVYGYREIDSMGGYDPYSSSKACVELITSAYRNSFFNLNEFEKYGVAISSARAGNIIGGGDWQVDRLIPDCIKALSRNEPISIRNPEAIRPWQFVLEPLAGYLLLAKLMYEDGVKYSGPWNFGPPDNDAISVEELVRKIISYWGKGEYKVETLLGSPHEAERLKLDCSKAHSLLRWHSVYNIERALKETVEWYKRYYGGTDNVSMIEYSISQIREHRKRGDYYVGDQKDSKERRC